VFSLPRPRRRERNAAPVIESGRLVPLSVNAQEAYHIVYVRSARDQPEVDAFVQWLLSEAESFGNGANG
jgi:DNA-binding transcriptional LysR family regulator